jgi:hypothetical protein
MTPGAARPNLPRVELGQFAAHGHDGEERKAAIGEQTEHVDAIAHAARLHQQGRPVAAEPGPRHRRHAFFLGGQGIGDDLRVLQGTADHMTVPGVGHIGDLPDAPVFSRSNNTSCQLAVSLSPLAIVPFPLPLAPSYAMRYLR